MDSLKDRLQSDLSSSMKSRDQMRTAALRMALAAVRSEEVAGSSARELTDEETVTAIRKEAKKRRESAEAFDSGGRDGQAERERAEAAVLEEYLPAQLSDGGLRQLVSDAITETGAEGPKAMGAVMRVVRPRAGERAEGSRVADEVRRQLAS